MSKRLLTMLLLLAVLVLGACRGGNPSPADQAAPGGLGQLAAPPARSVALAQLIDDITATPAPEGVEAGVYEKLKGQLVRELEGRGVSKIASMPPSGPKNMVDDLRLFDSSGGGMYLQWTYANEGDCNLDGLVSINDLTPIGQHFDESLDGSDWPVAQRADANHDGLVTINDVTPIGQNYETFCQGYHVFGADSESGPWNLLGDAALLPAVQTGPLVLTFDGLDGSYGFYEVRPHDDLGNEGEPSNIAIYTVSPRKAVLGADSWLLTDTIDPAGGTFQTDLTGPGDWVRFEFPPGAVDTPLSFRIGTNDGSYDPNVGILEHGIIAIDVGGTHSFHEPVHITVPWSPNDATLPYVPFIVKDDGSLELIDLIEADAEMQTMKFETYRLDPHLLWLKVQRYLGPIFRLRSSSFTPGLDDLQVVNTGSIWFPGGECFGMTSFSEWYFVEGKTWSEGNLYPRFMYNVPIYGGLSGQRIICTRAFASIVKDWPKYWDNFVAPQASQSDLMRYLAIAAGISNTGHPVLVDLRHENGAGGAHSVLAYAYDGSGITVYNPNTPGVPGTIGWNSGTDSFVTYSGYDSIRYSGSGALWVDEPFQYILDDAKHNFASNGFCTIQITSQVSGQNVLIGAATITGLIESTVELVTTLQINVNGSTTEVAVNPDGTFSTVVPILLGLNNFYFQTWTDHVDGTTAYIPNDMPGGLFYLIGLL